jgi:acylglycerol lipase
MVTWNTVGLQTPFITVSRDADVFTDPVGRYDAVFPIWAARDIAVFAFDLRGFGRTCFEGENPQASYGKTSGPDQLQDIEFFIKQLSPRFPNVPIFLMGFSMVR